MTPCATPCGVRLVAARCCRSPGTHPPAARWLPPVARPLPVQIPEARSATARCEAAGIRLRAAASIQKASAACILRVPNNGGRQGYGSVGGQADRRAAGGGWSQTSSGPSGGALTHRQLGSTDVARQHRRARGRYQMHRCAKREEARPGRAETTSRHHRMPARRLLARSPTGGLGGGLRRATPRHTTGTRRSCRGRSGRRGCARP